MKTERRHELQTNVLASHLAAWIERIKPYSTPIIVGIGIVVVGLMIFGYLAKLKADKEQAAWDVFTYAVTSIPPQVEGLDIQAREHADTSMSELATLTWADSQLFNAANTCLRNRSGARRVLKKTREVYKTLIATTERDEVRNRAQLGLARSFEMSNELEDAKNAYQKVGGKLAGIAEARLEELSQPGVSESLAWLATAKAIVPTAPAGPGTPGEQPLFGTEYDLTPPGGPTGSGLDTENIDLLETFRRATEEAEAGTPPSDMPAAAPKSTESSEGSDSGTAEPPVAETPAGELPAVELPVAETPAGELPAVELPAVELPAVELPGVELPAGELPGAELPGVELPGAELPAVETPAVETPAVETPAVETPAVETPAAETPAVETPAVETPAVETPAVETPAVETPAVETPAAETPAAETPAAETPAAETPGTEPVETAEESAESPSSRTRAKGAP